MNRRVCLKAPCYLAVQRCESFQHNCNTKHIQNIFKAKNFNPHAWKANLLLNVAHTPLITWLTLKMGKNHIVNIEAEQNGRHFPGDIFKCLSGIKMYKFRLIFHLSLCPMVQLPIFQHWFRWWLGAVQATSHYLNQWCVVYWRKYAPSASMH